VEVPSTPDGSWLSTSSQVQRKAKVKDTAADIRWKGLKFALPGREGGGKEKKDYFSGKPL